MGSKRALERRLSRVAGFETPRAEFEQYPTPADVAAHLLHFAALTGDLADRTVVDFGTGTGMLALGAALRGPTRVVGVDRDVAALRTARENEARVDPPLPVDWALGDATRPPLCPVDEPVTVVMNPPFGAQHGHRHADREFLAATAALADVSYSIHNEGSRTFVESFAADHGGRVTHAFRAELALSHQFDFHTSERTTLDAEVYRVAWTQP